MLHLHSKKRIHLQDTTVENNWNYIGLSYTVLILIVWYRKDRIFEILEISMAWSGILEGIEENRMSTTCLIQMHDWIQK